MNKWWASEVCFITGNWTYRCHWLSTSYCKWIERDNKCLTTVGGNNENQVRNHPIKKVKRCIKNKWQI